MFKFAFALLMVSILAEGQTLHVDHASFCGSDLDKMRQQFAAVGLATEYGGPHKVVTHMALLGFDDGSYLELIAPKEPAKPIPADQSWGKQMSGNAGPCAWAVEVSDIKTEVERLKKAGFKAEGPFPGERKKPDGTQIRWETGAVMDGERGSVLPFFIHDLTPRSNRVKPSPSVSGTELTGVAAVVIGVKDMNAAIAKFRKAYGWEEPTQIKDPEFGATLAMFQDGSVALPQPVVLAAPLASTSWLAKHIETYGEAPAALLIGSRDFDRSRTRLHVLQTANWFGRPIAWLDSQKLGGARVGIIGTVRFIN